MGWFKLNQITSKPVNQVICIIILPIVFCNLVSIKNIVIIIIIIIIISYG